MIWDVVAVKVWDDRGIVPTVRPPYEAPAGPYAKSCQPHHACYPLVIDREPVTAKLVGHAPLAVAGQFILDVFDDGREFGFCQPLGKDLVKS